jgi:hypothetical protein
MKTIYVKNGELGDEKGVGVTLATFLQDDAGNWLGVHRTSAGEAYLGYLAEEITLEEFTVWKNRIAFPDLTQYYPGIFAGIGVVDKRTYTANQAGLAKARAAYVEEEARLNRINFKLAKRDAEAIGEDFEAVFMAKHPLVSSSARALLFKEEHANQSANSDKKK